MDNLNYNVAVNAADPGKKWTVPGEWLRPG